MPQEIILTADQWAQILQALVVLKGSALALCLGLGVMSGCALGE